MKEHIDFGGGTGDAGTDKGRPISNRLLGFPNRSLYMACSFCGKHEVDVSVLIAIETAAICRECVQTCNAILVDHDLREGIAKI